MTWKQVLDPEIRIFIKTHDADDVAALGLKKPPNPDWPYKLILDQIKSRQKARKKIPLWLDHHPDIVFPAPPVLEQASSAATARYKAGLIKGRAFCDLTGGAGVDSCALTEHYEEGVCIDSDQENAELIAHNLALLSSKAVNIRQAKAEEFVKDMNPVDLAVIDPQRRDENRKGKYRFEECSPNILDFLPVLKEKAKTIMIKTSPMLDIDEGIRQLGSVCAVHVVEWQGECKELIYIIQNNGEEAARDYSPEGGLAQLLITAVRLNDAGEAAVKLQFTRTEEKQAESGFSAPQKYLFEPGPAFQKAGGFRIIGKTYGLTKLHPNTHLYTGDMPYSEFPGKQFEILDVLPIDAQALPGDQFNLVLRNFPEKQETLKKRLKIKDGGEKFLFATTLFDNRKVFIHARKC